MRRLQAILIFKKRAAASARSKKATKKQAARKRAEHEPKLKTDLSFDQLIAMSVNKVPEDKTDKNK